MNDIEASIIIPVYNTEAFLPECIDSVLKQRDASSMEIILVNDGSPDGSLQICKKYEQENENITVIDKKNEGAAVARNVGVEQARGEYLLFMDSDDYYLDIDGQKKTLRILVDAIRETKVDILCFNYTRSDDRRPQRKAPARFVDNKSELVQRNIFTSGAWPKIYKKSVLVENEIHFLPNTLAEDILFAGKFLRVSDVKIAFLNEVVYFYRVRDNSMTKSLTTKHVEDMLATIDELRATNDETVLAYTSFQYATLLINISSTKDKVDKELLKRVYALRYLLRYNRSKVVRLIYFTDKIIGTTATSKLLSMAYKTQEKMGR